MARIVITERDIQDSAIISSKIKIGAVIRNKIAEFRPHQNDPIDDKVYVEAGKILSSDAKKTITFGGGSSPSFNVITGGGNSRIDLLCINDSGNLEIIEGIEAGVPTIPEYPSNKRVIAEVTIDELVTVTITDSDINDVRDSSGILRSSLLDVQEDGIDIVTDPSDINFKHGFDITNAGSGVAQVDVDETELNLYTEVVNARGTKASLDERLDISLNEDGTLKTSLRIDIQEDGIDVVVDPSDLNFRHGLDITDLGGGIAGIDIDEGELNSSLIPNTPAGNISSTNIQDAINELDNEKVAKAGDTISGSLTINTDLNIKGDTILGDANTDVTSIRGKLTLTDNSATYPLQLGVDTNLYRQAADILKTDDDLIVGGNISGDGSGITNIGSSSLNDGSVIRSKINILRPHEQNTPDDTVYVESGRFIKSDGTSSIDFAGGNSPSFNVVTANSRIDLLCIDDTGTLVIIEGIQAASPVSPAYPIDKQVIAEVTIDETSGVVINNSDIKDVRMFLNLGGGSGNGGIFRRYIYVASGGETFVDLPFAYTTGNNSLQVFRGDGLLQKITDDYTETSSTRVTFTSALIANEIVQFLVIVTQPTTRYEQSFTSQTSVTVIHNLGIKPLIQIVDNSNQVIIPNTITHDSINQATITFLSSQSGIVICNAGTSGRADLVNEYKAGVALNTFEIVYQTTTADEVAKANATNTSKIPAIGITITSASIGEKIDILQVGLVSNSAWSWTPGDKIYVNTVDGQLTNTAPAGSGNVIQKIGIAKNATTVLFNFGYDYIVLS